jgi:hypothetical protein
MPKYEFDMPDGTKRQAEGVSPEDAWDTIHAPHNVNAPATSETPDSGGWGQTALDVGRGAARGLAGLASTVSDISPWSPKLPDDPVRKFAAAPSANFAESAGRFAGETVPFMFQPELGASRAIYPVVSRVMGWGPAQRVVTGALSRGVEGAAQGATSGFMQPTESRTRQSHLENAKTGALAGGALGGISRLLNTPQGRAVMEHLTSAGQFAGLHGLAHMLGVSPYLQAIGIPWYRHSPGHRIYNAIHGYSPLTKIAGAAGPMTKRLAPQAGAAVAGDSPRLYVSPEREDKPPPKREEPKREKAPPAATARDDDKDERPNLHVGGWQ